MSSYMAFWCNQLIGVNHQNVIITGFNYLVDNIYTNLPFAWFRRHMGQLIFYLKGPGQGFVPVF